MDRYKLFSILAKLDFPAGQWAVFGGACLTAYGLRTTDDLEIFVTQPLYDVLRMAGWEEKVTNSTGAAYVTRAVDGIPVLAFVMCGSEKWLPDAAGYIRHPERINGVPFMPLRELRAWKAATARPKDIADLSLIDAYLQTAD